MNVIALGQSFSLSRQILFVKMIKFGKMPRNLKSLSGRQLLRQFSTFSEVEKEESEEDDDMMSNLPQNDLSSDFYMPESLPEEIGTNSKLFAVLYNAKDFMSILHMFETLKPFINQENVVYLIRSLSKKVLTLTYYDKHIMRQETSIRLTKVLDHIELHLNEETSVYNLTELLYFMRILQKTRLTPITTKNMAIKTLNFINKKIEKEKGNFNANLLVSIYNEAILLDKYREHYMGLIDGTLTKMVEKFGLGKAELYSEDSTKVLLNKFEGSFLTPSSIFFLIKAIWNDQKQKEGIKAFRNGYLAQDRTQKMLRKTAILLNIFYADFESNKKPVLFFMISELFQANGLAQGPISKIIRVLEEDLTNQKTQLGEKDLLYIWKGYAAASRSTSEKLISFIRNTSIATIHTSPSYFSLEYLLEFMKSFKKSQLRVYPLSENVQILFLNTIMERIKALPSLPTEEETERQAQKGGNTPVKIFNLMSRDSLDSASKDQTLKRADVSKRLALWNRVLDIIDPQCQEQNKVAQWIYTQALHINPKLFHLTSGAVLIEKLSQNNVDCSELLINLMGSISRLPNFIEISLVFELLYVLEHPLTGNFEGKEKEGEFLYGIILKKLTDEPFRTIYCFASKYRQASSPIFAKIKQKIQKMIMKSLAPIVLMNPKKKLLLSLLICGFKEPVWIEVAMNLINTKDNFSYSLTDMISIYNCLPHSGSREIVFILEFMKKIKKENQLNSPEKFLNWPAWLFAILNRIPIRHLRDKNGYIIRELLEIFDEPDSMTVPIKVKYSDVFLGVSKIILENFDMDQPFLRRLVSHCCELYEIQFQKGLIDFASQAFVVTASRKYLSKNVHTNLAQTLRLGLQHFNSLGLVEEKKASKQLQIMLMIQYLEGRPFEQPELIKNTLKICVASLQSTDPVANNHFILLKIKTLLLCPKEYYSEDTFNKVLALLDTCLQAANGFTLSLLMEELGESPESLAPEAYFLIEKHLRTRDPFENHMSLHFWNSFVKIAQKAHAIENRPKLQKKLVSIILPLLKKEKSPRNVALFVRDSLPSLVPFINMDTLNELVLPHIPNMIDKDASLCNEVFKIDHP